MTTPQEANGYIPAHEVDWDRTPNAKLEGYIAGTGGKIAADNPYMAETPEHEQWHRGCMNAWEGALCDDIDYPTCHGI